MYAALVARFLGRHGLDVWMEKVHTFTTVYVEENGEDCALLEPSWHQARLVLGQAQIDPLTEEELASLTAHIGVPTRAAHNLVLHSLDESLSEMCDIANVPVLPPIHYIEKQRKLFTVYTKFGTMFTPFLFTCRSFLHPGDVVCSGETDLYSVNDDLILHRLNQRGETILFSLKNPRPFQDALGYNAHPFALPPSQDPILATLTAVTSITFHQLNSGPPARENTNPECPPGETDLIDLTTKNDTSGQDELPPSLL